MDIFVVVYRRNGYNGQKIVMANNTEEATDKFNNWRETQVSKCYLSKAIRAYKVEVIK